MSSTVTLQEVREELAKFPQVMLMPGDQRINPSINTLTIEIDDKTKEDLPKLSGFLERARLAANNYSSLDMQIPEVDIVIITNDSDYVFTGFVVDNKGKRNLIIRTDILLVLNEEMVLAMLTHEYKHHHHINSDMERLSIELNGDRAAENSLALCATLLTLMTSEEFSGHYYANNDNQHPPLRDRIRAALRESYGDGAFRDSGAYSADWQFQPKRQDFIPVLEDGKKILNWDSELAPVIQQLLDEDMHYLDTLVGTGGHPIKAQAVSQFINYEKPRIEAFYEKHILNAELPSNNYLAQQFEKALQVPALREAVMSMHEKMPLAFKAYDEAVKQAGHFITPSAQDAIINTARQNIVEGISEGIYPEAKPSQLMPEVVSIPVVNAVELAQ
ncbi:MAG TPA: hypothetical protein VIO39_01120 [Methylotenera sp.]